MECFKAGRVFGEITRINIVEFDFYLFDEFAIGEVVGWILLVHLVLTHFLALVLADEPFLVTLFFAGDLETFFAGALFAVVDFLAAAFFTGAAF